MSFYEDRQAKKIFFEKTTDLNHLNIVNVQCFSLYSILLAVGRTNVDYFSVDAEESGLQILTNIPWHKVNIKVNYST